MDSTELITHLQTLADVVDDSHTDVSTCLITIIGALENERMEELSDIMVGFTIDTVGELVQGDAAKTERFQEILRDALTQTSAMEQRAQ